MQRWECVSVDGDEILIRIETKNEIAEEKDSENLAPHLLFSVLICRLRVVQRIHRYAGKTIKVGKEDSIISGTDA